MQDKNGWIDKTGWIDGWGEGCSQTTGDWIGTVGGLIGTGVGEG